jgi:predicted RNA methylase
MKFMMNNSLKEPQNAIKPSVHPSSFRDVDSQVYNLDGSIYRQIHHSGYADYEHLMSSGLYEELQALKYLIPHKECPLDRALNQQAKIVISPEQIHFISYCYEWSFSQYKDAALLTLELAKRAMNYEMILKDASAYNIQFHQGTPILIDTGSFTLYREGEPWIAYGQFCRHFLAPLLLMSKLDIGLSALMKHYIDGIPLTLASQMLSAITWFSPSILAHLHAHAKLQKKYDGAGGSVNEKISKISKVQLLGMLDNLSRVISKLKLKLKKTEWSNYYKHTNYSEKAAQNKTNLLKQLLNQARAKYIWDLGSNNGHYSRIAAQTGAQVTCFDIDPIAVETHYLEQKKNHLKNLLPLLLDLTNPSSSLGWAQNERFGLKERGSADLIMALALIHHLAISHNIPLASIAEYFSKLGTYLIIEFVPKEDSQVQHLLSSRPDIFPGYHVEQFKKVFSRYYTLVAESPIAETYRTLFLMKRI